MCLVMFDLIMMVSLLQICMDHILAVLRIPAERSSGFIALGEMAGALDGELIPYLPTITLHLRDAVCILFPSSLFVQSFSPDIM